MISEASLWKHSRHRAWAQPRRKSCSRARSVTLKRIPVAIALHICKLKLPALRCRRCCTTPMHCIQTFGKPRRSKLTASKSSWLRPFSSSNACELARLALSSVHRRKSSGLYLSRLSLSKAKDLQVTTTAWQSPREAPCAAHWCRSLASCDS